MASQRVQVRPVAGAIGAEIEGVDLSRPLDEATFAAIHRAFLDHLVIFVRDQEITPDRQLDFARRFGPIGRYPFVAGLPEYPDVVAVLKEAHEKANFGGVWHSDTAYLERPPMGSVLYAKELPPAGGDTLFANMYLAYETLSAGMRRLLDGLRAVNSSAKGAAAVGRQVRRDTHPQAGAPDVMEAEHPVVRTHPETGRKALYVNVGHTTRFAGMTVAESVPLLAYLFEHAVRPELTCRFRWSPGALAVWDNRCAQHYAMNDYHGHRRLMHRVTMEGDRPQ